MIHIESLCLKSYIHVLLHYQSCGGLKAGHGNKMHTLSKFTSYKNSQNVIIDQPAQITESFE